MTIQEARLNIGGYEMPVLPLGENVDIAFAAPLEGYVLLDGTPGSQAQAAKATVFDIRGDSQMVGLPTKRAIEALYRSALAFTLIETYSDPELVSTWLGCIFKAQPKFTEIAGSGRLYYHYQFVIQGGTP